MQQEKYQHATWGFYLKDSVTDQVIYDLNSDKMFLPASTTKLFSSAALLNAYGADYRFKTPVYALGTIEGDRLTGDLVLVAQGDLTFGGRQDDTDKISFTKLDHINANSVPGTLLTPEDPLHAFKNLASQIHDKGIQEVHGNILIDDRLFETSERRGLTLSPILVNENMIDIVLNPGETGNTATLSWRPKVSGYTVTNSVQTVKQGEPLNIEITADDLGRNITVKGTLPINEKNLVRTFAIKDPRHFAKAAFMDALKEAGIKITQTSETPPTLQPQAGFGDIQPIAVWTSPPLSEYVKLILKVSHNLGADLVPVLLAVKEGKTTFNEGMQLIGDFVIDDVKLPWDSFVFLDAAGGDENRLTPKAEVILLDFVKKKSPYFQSFYEALPIQGVDGSLEDFAKNRAAKGKVRAKPGTGVTFNPSVGKFFLTTQALAGYVEGKNGHLLEFMLAVNNGTMPKIDDIFPIFEDLSQIMADTYDLSD